MNESSRRCRRFSCSIRSHNHSHDHLATYFNYPDDYNLLYHCNISHSKLISNYKRIKYGKYDEFLILDITNNILKTIEEYEEDESLSFLIYLFELLKTSNLLFFCKQNIKFYKMVFQKYTELKSNELFLKIFPTFDIIDDYYDFLVHCYNSINIEEVKFWNDYKNKVIDSDNIFSEIVSFL